MDLKLYISVLCFLFISCTLVLCDTGVNAAKKTSFEDARCKCVCGHEQGGNSTSNRKVYVSSNVDPNQCKCDNVVKPSEPVYCNQCECKYESRNTTTIKVVVIIIICIVALLLVYMLFLLCLDPLIAHRPSSYQEHTNEEVNLPRTVADDQSVTRVPQFDAPSGRGRTRLSRQRSIINTLTDEQKKWKGTVQEQRKNIYDRHSMLN